MCSNSLIDFFYVYQYQFIDNLSYILPPSTFYDDTNLMEKQIAIVKKIFVENGWEGDGKIGLIWIPPFLDESFDDSCGSLVWHVKQDNDGISFIASERKLFSNRLLENLRKQLKEASDLKNDKHLSDKLYNSILVFIQNDIVSNLNVFIDECYLKFLFHIFNCKNVDDLKLKPIKAN
ncbi:hypothetical protein [Clostridium diolis]|uniref:hypothetical protein n=1 Tax=Clostridium diolis TaxID=223919 RepID=UPI003AF64AFC